MKDETPDEMRDDVHKPYHKDEEKYSPHEYSCPNCRKYFGRGPKAQKRLYEHYRLIHGSYVDRVRGR